MFNRRKLGYGDIVVSWNGIVPHYSALLCIDLFLDGNKGKAREFTKKDLRLVGGIKLRIEREKMTWFEIKEEPGAFYLYFYPDIYLEASKIRDKELHKDVPGWSEEDGPKHVTNSLERISKMFNSMLQ